jgi:DNA invertase Pin-like site-specific DNA recombinase
MDNQIVSEVLSRHVTDIIEPEQIGNAVLYLRVSTSRQAYKNGEAEGYSIPAQRDACTRKARELGGQVMEEFVDAGESARSADRPELQRMLKYIAEHPVSYVIVHKLDRLARDRADDVTLLMAIKAAGAALVSVSENIDDTPAGKLQHGIMASMAEYYSSNLSHEAKKGIAQKAKRGGTHGVAPIGYLNTVTRVEGRDIKGVAIDTERAGHIHYAFRAYAEGNISIATLTDLLEERGLRSRKTLKYEGKALSNSQVHRMLGNPYYIGKIRHRGVIYDGSHDPLIDDDTWYQVQSLLSGRRLAGDRAWKHDHPLKGLLTCGRCGGRMGYGHSKGRGGIYTYFFCLGRHTGRTTCDLPYISVESIEQAMQSDWDTRVQFTPEEVDRARAAAYDILDTESTDASKLHGVQRKRLRTLQLKKQRLIDAYLDGVLPAEDIRPRQEQVSAEIADAERLIRESGNDAGVVRSHVDLLLTLMIRAGDLYRTVSDSTRRLLNQAVFTGASVDVSDDEDASQAREVSLMAALAPPVAAIVELARPGAIRPNTPHKARRGATGPVPARVASQAEENRTPGSLSLAGGSNVFNLAETGGFEPPVRF